jgi:hypothetical protein
MSEGPSDPDLLDLDDLPDTGTAMSPPDMHGLVKGVRGLGRWAVRQHAERKWLRSTAFSILAAVVAGALGMIGTVVGAALYIGSRLERVESLGHRVEVLEERAWQAHAGSTKRADEED